jgi:hypothetical protein
MATVENKAFLFSRYDPPIGRLRLLSGDCCLPESRLLSDSFYSCALTTDPLPTDCQIIGK